MEAFKVFEKPLDEYLIRINPLQEYIKQTSMYYSKINKVDVKKAEEEIKKIVKEFPLENPTVQYRYRNDVGDTEYLESGILDYIKNVQNEGEVLVPSFTTYLHPKKRKSLHAEFLFMNVRARAEDKKKAFKYKLDKNAKLAIYYNTMQKSRKVFNNAVSGTYATSGTIISNPPSHYTLTSITACVSSIGNAMTECLVSGNRIYTDPESIMNYITTILCNINFDDVKNVIEKYNLYIPTVDDVYNMIVDIAKYYFNVKDKLKYIKELLETLNGYELAAIMYVNDLWHIKEYNNDWVHEMLTKLSKKCTGLVGGKEEQLEVLKTAHPDLLNLLHHICADMIRGMNVNYENLVGTDIGDTLASTVFNITNTFNYYADFFQTFFITKVMPINIGRIKDMLRNVIILSDTDSTCGSYDDWVQWYCNDVKVTEQSIGVAATVSCINAFTISHYLKLFAGSMNIDKERIDLLKMKNEYFWYTFVPMNKNKHYFADTAIKEGNVFEETEGELKGVHLISSGVEETLRQQAFQLMDEIKEKAKDGLELDVTEYIDKVIKIEKELIERVKKGDIDILTTDTIKPPKAYKQEPNKSKYQYHLAWEFLFADKYGNAGEPIYGIINIPTTLDTPKALRTFIENHPNKEFAKRFDEYCKKNNKSTYGCFRIPILRVEEHGIPDEIIDCIDYFRIVTACCIQFYNVLESIHAYRKPDLLACEGGYGAY